VEEERGQREQRDEAQLRESGFEVA